MLQCLSGTSNQIYYISRYNKIDYFTILNHATNQTVSGTTELYAYQNNGRILHNLDYDFEDKQLYTYKAYFKYQDQYYLSFQSLIKTWNDNRMENYVSNIENDDNYFIVYKD